jgi:AcrR family transcriptional regulator
MANPAWSLRPLDELDAEQMAAYEERRARLLDAAATAVRQHGAAVKMTDVAKQAGLGMSSVYRTFARKEDVFMALLEIRKAQWLKIWQKAEQNPNPGPALFEALAEFGELEHSDLKLAAAVRELALRRRDLVPETAAIGDRVLRRAQAAGEVRADVEYWDILRLFHMLTDIDDDRAWRRGLAIYIDGLRAPEGLRTTLR